MFWSNINTKYKRLTVITGSIVLLDQVTKAAIFMQLPLYHSVSIIPGLFNLTHIHNPGGAFGFLSQQSSNVRNFLFLFISFLAIGFIFYFYRNTPKTHPWLANGFALILGGAVGNLIDRLRIGKVVDFLDFYLGSYHWPAFNVADSAISVGVGIFLIHLLFKKMPE